MLANFQTINRAFLADHVALTAVDNVGMHNSLTLRAQVTDPTTGSNQCALYNKIVSTVPQLFFRPSNNSTPIQMSNSNLNTIQTGATANAQSSFIAGPFTVYFGYIDNCPNGQLVTLLPASNLIYVGLTTVLLGNITPTVGTTSTAFSIIANTFTVRYNATEIPTPPLIYYTAVGL